MMVNVLGMTEEQAISLIESEGLHSRVSKRDGVAQILTRDYRTDRINLDVKDGVVIAASIG